MEQNKPNELGVSGNSASQSASRLRDELTKLKTAKQKAGVELRQLQYFPLDGAIDGDTYILGPHDVLAVQAWGASTIDEMVEVSPDGCVVLPGFGAITIAGKTWNEAKKIISDSITVAYNPKRSAVTLVGVRVFIASITGSVQFPGEFQLGATQRIWELVTLAGGITGIADLSKVIVRHKNGDSTIVDMTSYFAYGDADANPYVRDGDIINIPPIDTKHGTIRLYAPAVRNGIYGISPDNASLKAMAHRLGIFRHISDASAILVTRDDDIHTVNLLADDFTLQNGDVVIFPSTFDSVFVGGMVSTGGVFPYYPDISAEAYIAMANGPSEKGSVSQFSVYRDGKKISFSRHDKLKPGDVIIVKYSTYEKFKDFTETVAKILSSTMTILYVVDRLTN